jgi:hypothetical protein
MIRQQDPASGTTTSGILRRHLGGDAEEKGVTAAVAINLKARCVGADQERITENFSGSSLGAASSPGTKKGS